MRKQKKGKTLEVCFPISQYLGILWVALSFPLIPEYTRLLPGVNGSRIWLTAWLPLLMGVAFLMDRAYLRAYKRDIAEIEQKVPHGGLNRSTLLAIGVPCLFIADFAAIVHLYLSFLRGGGSLSVIDTTVMLRIAAMAVGAVLWVYGRMLPKIPFQSVWGIRTRNTVKDVQTWGLAHLKACRLFCLFGAAALVAGVFLPPVLGLGAAVVCCGAALAGAMRL